MEHLEYKTDFGCNYVYNEPNWLTIAETTMGNKYEVRNEQDYHEIRLPSIGHQVVPSEDYLMRCVSAIHWQESRRFEDALLRLVQLNGSQQSAYSTPLDQSVTMEIREYGTYIQIEVRFKRETLYECSLTTGRYDIQDLMMAVRNSVRNYKRVIFGELNKAYRQFQIHLKNYLINNREVLGIGELDCIIGDTNYIIAKFKDKGGHSWYIKNLYEFHNNPRCSYVNIDNEIRVDGIGVLPSETGSRDAIDKSDYYVNILEDKAVERGYAHNRITSILALAIEAGGFNELHLGLEADEK